MKNIKLPLKNPPFSKNTIIMETQTRDEKRPSLPPLPLPPSRTSTRSAIKLDLSINIGESSAIPVYPLRGRGASVPRRGPGRFTTRGPPSMNSGRREGEGVGLGLSLRSLRDPAARSVCSNFN